MVLGDLCDYLSGPYLLVHQLLAIIYTDDKVDRSPKYDRLLLGNIQIKKEGILIIGIQTQRQPPMFYSLNRLRIHINLINTKPKHNPIHYLNLSVGLMSIIRTFLISNN